MNKPAFKLTAKNGTAIYTWIFDDKQAAIDEGVRLVTGGYWKTAWVDRI